jgi:hypothetical protein
MEGLDKGGQGPTSGCCSIKEEEEVTNIKPGTAQLVKQLAMVCMGSVLFSTASSLTMGTTQPPIQ